MHHISNVALLVQTSHMSNRINTIIKAEKGSSHEAQDPLKFLNMIEELGNDINLVIIDFDMGIEEGFSILSKVKIKNPKVPIIVLTSNNKKELFLKTIMAGVGDFILKPFEDDFLKERIQGFLRRKSEEPNEVAHVISKSLDEYVNSEISKANKGKYSFSVLMTTFFKPLDEVSLRQENEYKRLSVDLHKSLSEVIWVTDVLIQYGNQSFIGIFPFCDIDNVNKIHDKIVNKFHEVKSADIRLTNYHIANAFATYPTEGNDFVEIMSKLTSRMKDAIIEMKNMKKPVSKADE
ncbi:MAG: transcriptional regulator [Clostridia bacterium]|jgi:DNA-binding response OmpR family regulator|nr:transcriptional regulator [Clostridia bacterium]